MCFVFAFFLSLMPFSVCQVSFLGLYINQTYLLKKVSLCIISRKEMELLIIIILLTFSFSYLLPTSSSHIQLQPSSLQLQGGNNLFLSHELVTSESVSKFLLSLSIKQTPYYNFSYSSLQMIIWEQSIQTCSFLYQRFPES